MFPREYLRARLPTVHDCSHATNFESGDPECRACRANRECGWLCDNDEYSALETATTDRVVAAIRSVLDQALVDVSRHKACSCSTCTWLRRATKVMKRVDASGVEPLSARPR